MNDGITETDIRLEWFGPEPRVGAIHYGGELPLAIRLGSTVAIKTDGDSVAVDPAAMSGVPGAPRDAGRSARKAPDQGVDDRALDMRVLSRIEKWAPQDATVESFEQVRLMGMLAENWTILVACADGTRATVRRTTSLPTYAGTSSRGLVPVVTDPKDVARAQVNWP